MTTNFQFSPIPSQAYLYFPQGIISSNDSVLTLIADDMKTPQGDRLIFDGNTQFDANEHSKISDFKTYAHSHHYTLSSKYLSILSLYSSLD